MLETLFESVDEKVFTPELKEKITEAFNDAVDTKSHLIAEDLKEETKAQLNEEAENYKQQLDEAFEQYVDDYQHKLLENVNNYLSKIVDDFVTENSQKLNEMVKPHKADALLSLFEKTTNVLGEELSDIVNENAAKVRDDSESYKDECNSLMESNLQLKEDLFNTKKAAIAAELSEGLTIPQQDAFRSLVEMHFKGMSGQEKYDLSLEDLEESITKIKNNIEVMSESRASRTDDSMDDSLNESDTSTKQNRESFVDWKRFV